MRQKREFVEGAFYHVTSRTNDKIRVFENSLGRKIMLMALRDAKDKFRFDLANFCVMPTHVHLLIRPGQGESLSLIMHWVKTHSAKRWNSLHGSTDHMWGNRYFAGIVNGQRGFDAIMDYIDQNAVKAGLAEKPEDWQASGAFCRDRNIAGMVDFPQAVDGVCYSVPPAVSKLLPLEQLEHVSKYLVAYAGALEKLSGIVPTIPKTAATDTTKQPVYLRYFSQTADYRIHAYDGQDSLFGKVRFNAYPAEVEYQNFSLSRLKNGPFMQLDFSWMPDARASVPGTRL